MSAPRTNLPDRPLLPRRRGDLSHLACDGGSGATAGDGPAARGGPRPPTLPALRPIGAAEDRKRRQITVLPGHSVARVTLRGRVSGAPGTGSRAGSRSPPGPVLAEVAEGRR